MKTCKPNLFAAYAQKNAVHTLKNICNDLSPLCEEIVWRSARISLTPCEDIVNTLRGYRQHPARISSTPCEDIVIFRQAHACLQRHHGQGHHLLPLFHPSASRNQRLSIASYQLFRNFAVRLPHGLYAAAAYT